MTALEPLPGFDWAKVKWGGPMHRPSDDCSYCATEIPEDSVPLIIWKEDGSCARFCDACMRNFWGFQSW